MDEDIVESIWKNDMKQPFMFLKGGEEYQREIYDDFSMPTILKTAPNEPLPKITPGEMEDFPQNITRVYFSYKGKNDEEDWRLVGRCGDDNKFFFFKANCCYTGFDAGSEMKLYVSRHSDILEEYCMDDITRYLFNKKLKCEENKDDVSKPMSQDENLDESDNDETVEHYINRMKRLQDRPKPLPRTDGPPTEFIQLASMSSYEMEIYGVSL
jgi:hypothetical protein